MHGFAFDENNLSKRLSIESTSLFICSGLQMKNTPDTFVNNRVI